MCRGACPTHCSVLEAELGVSRYHTVRIPVGFASLSQDYESHHPLLAAGDRPPVAWSLSLKALCGGHRLDVGYRQPLGSCPAFAWGRMIYGYSHTMTVADAVEKTFAPADK